MCSWVSEETEQNSCLLVRVVDQHPPPYVSVSVHITNTPLHLHVGGAVREVLLTEALAAAAGLEKRLVACVREHFFGVKSAG